MSEADKVRIAVVGLGYVGLPLAVEFGKILPTLGFDISAKRVAELRQGLDRSSEISPDALAEAGQLSFSSDPNELSSASVYILTVPTPIDRHKRPDLGALTAACDCVGGALKPNDVVIVESTVYPGATEEVCVPALERASGLVFNRDFFMGYSPERMNPGDKEHTLSNIIKVTSGSTPQTADFVDALYRRVVKAGTFKTSSIRVAEAAKAIENTQRDLNIALVNELALIFHRLGIDTQEVLDAAGTKWNFLPFRPGLVGGHCIGVDPYYLTHKAQEIGYHPEVILAGRRINDGMGTYVAERVIKLMTENRVHVVDARILVMGLSFKENCPDLRNTRVIDTVRALRDYHAAVDVYDPWVDPEEAMSEYGLKLIDKPASGHYDAIILAVAHHQFQTLTAEDIRSFGKEHAVVFDVKYLLPRQQTDGRL